MNPCINEGPSSAIQLQCLDTLPCTLQVNEDKLQCSQLQEVTQASDMTSLPHNAVLFQQQPVLSQPEGLLYTVEVPQIGKQFAAAGASFGAQLQAPEEAENNNAAPDAGLHGELRVMS